LFALDLQGNLIDEDTDIFGTTTLVHYGMGLNIDLENPDCRIIAYSATDDGTGWFARYSGDLTEKKSCSHAIFYTLYGLCRGMLQSDGTLWATPDTGVSRLYKFGPLSDW
jgi:hypothetical protein